MRYKRGIVITIAAGALMLIGCSQKTDPPAGTERGACYGNGTCNEGLICLSDLCVRPPPADCAKIATRLNYLLLGNYAKQAERDAFVAEHVAICQEAMLSKEDGDCILAAKSREALAQCARPLALGSCEKVIDHVLALGASGNLNIEGLANGNRDTLLRECRRRAITRAQEACVLKATTMQAIQACDRK